MVDTLLHGGGMPEGGTRQLGDNQGLHNRGRHIQAGDTPPEQGIRQERDIRQAPDTLGRHILGEGGTDTPEEGSHSPPHDPSLRCLPCPGCLLPVLLGEVDWGTPLAAPGVEIEEGILQGTLREEPPGNPLQKIDKEK